MLQPLLRKERLDDYIDQTAAVVTIEKRVSKNNLGRLCSIEPLPSSWKNMAAMKSICHPRDHFELCIHCDRCGAETLSSQCDMDESLHDVLSYLRSDFQSLQEYTAEDEDDEVMHKHKWKVDIFWIHHTRT